jgi:hypothetical protein
MTDLWNPKELHMNLKQSEPAVARRPRAASQHKCELSLYLAPSFEGDAGSMLCRTVRLPFVPGDGVHLVLRNPLEEEDSEDDFEVASVHWNHSGRRFYVHVENPRGCALPNEQRKALFIKEGWREAP